MELLINEDEVSKHYMLPEMLRGMGNTETANVLLKYAKNNTVKFKENYQWAWRMVEAILICEPTMVEELISFGLDGKINDNGKEDRLERVIQGICIKSQPVIKPSAMSFFMKLPSKVQYRLIPVFFKDKRREVLTPIMQFIYEKQANIDSKIYLNQLVKFNNSDEINEFLASIPMPSTHGKMLLHNSILFGILESIIWKEQNTIRSQCISVFEQNCTDEKILLNALRVLVFLQDDRCLTIAKQIPFKKDSFLSTFAGFIPLFFKHKVDFEEYRMRVLDVELDNEIRLQAFFVLSAAGIDIGQTLDELEKIDEGSANIWDFSALMFSIQNPSKRVIPIFEKSFEDSPENNPFLILINRFGELDGDDVTDFLLRMLRSRLSEANILACLSLQNRRDKRALPALLSLIRESNDVQIVQTALVAAIASGPDNINEFMDIWERFPESYLWRCVLIGRLRASSDADWLCEIAIDKNQHWQLRRTAVMAASRLPFELALEKIYLTIMGEESSFKIDNHPSLIMHNIIAPLVLKEGGALLRFYLRGEDAFVDFWGDLFKEMSQGASYPAPEGSEKSTATWLFHKLTEEGFPKNQSAQDSILNDLHIPIVQASILRGFRLCNRIDLIEKYIMEANSEWLLLRSICEWAKHNYTDADIDRLKKLVAKTSFQSSVCVKNVLSNISRPIVSKTSQSDIYKTFQTCNLEPRVTLHFQDIIDAIDSGRFKYDENYSIENMSKDKFIYLVNELNPSNDYKISHDINEPAIGFGESGPLIKEMKPISISANNENKVRKYLRTLIATFNKYEVDIPWHKSLLSGGAGHHDHIAYEYGLGFLRLLGKQGNMDMFYSELEKYHYDILPRMDKYLSDPLVKCLIDDRIVPYLRRYVNAGTDKMLLSVCSLASYLDSPAVDQVLSDLFYRWYNKFDRASKDTQHNNNRELWQSFNILKKHPRFKVICDYDVILQFN
ncbi:HEAT repeat domain-containing protein [Denitrovibrio acetiphilus]|nr:HEAT repeat domain-containing protein [Denitrovibrio acetiphilus]